MTAAPMPIKARKPQVDKALSSPAPPGWWVTFREHTRVIFRECRSLLLPCEKRLPDGSYLSRVFASEKDRRRGTGGVIVRVIEYHLEGIEGAEPLYRLVTTILDHEQAPASELAALYHERWEIGVSRQGHIVQPVKVRPRPTDSGLVAWEASWRESKSAKPSDYMLGKEYAQPTRLQCNVNADVASLHEIPVAETVDNARKQQELAETSPIRQLSPAGYQRRHGGKDDVETGEALGARRRNPVEEMPAITVSGKCWHRHQGDGSGCSTDEGRAAKRAWREGPGPVSNSVRQGEAGAR